MNHRHFDQDTNTFYDHEHLHSGPHRHTLAQMDDGRLVEVVDKVPGNYAPARKEHDEEGR